MASWEGGRREQRLEVRQRERRKRTRSTGGEIKALHIVNRDIERCGANANASPPIDADAKLLSFSSSSLQEAAEVPQASPLGFHLPISKNILKIHHHHHQIVISIVVVVSIVDVWIYVNKTDHHVTIIDHYYNNHLRPSVVLSSITTKIVN